MAKARLFLQKRNRSDQNQKGNRGKLPAGRCIFSTVHKYTVSFKVWSSESLKELLRIAVQEPQFGLMWNPGKRVLISCPGVLLYAQFQKREFRKAKLDPGTGC